MWSGIRITIEPATPRDTLQLHRIDPQDLANPLHGDSPPRDDLDLDGADNVGRVGRNSLVASSSCTVQAETEDAVSAEGTDDSDGGGALYEVESGGASFNLEEAMRCLRGESGEDGGRGSTSRQDLLQMADSCNPLKCSIRRSFSLSLEGWLLTRIARWFSACYCLTGEISQTASSESSDRPTAEMEAVSESRHPCSTQGLGRSATPGIALRAQKNAC